MTIKYKKNENLYKIILLQILLKFMMLFQKFWSTLLVSVLRSSYNIFNPRHSLGQSVSVQYVRARPSLAKGEFRFGNKACP